MTDETRRRGPGRPRKHATPEEAAAARARTATEHTRARRQARRETAVAMTPETRAKADALVEARRLAGYSDLFEVLVDEEIGRGP